MAKVKRIEPCALCGEMRPVTREHVPPKNLFLAPRPLNTITVPVCEPCNHGYHLDDEYFRVYVASGAIPGTRLWRLWKEKVVGSSFARSGGLKGRLNDDHFSAIEHHRIQPLRTFDNTVIPDELLPLVQLFEASRINSIVAKIVRCLHFSQTGIPLSRNAVINIDTAPLHETDLHLLSEGLRTGCVGNHEEFVFWHKQINLSTWRWLLRFYEARSFNVQVHIPT